jgi:MFS transporter, DHA2 family, multidrug resistance protein
LESRHPKWIFVFLKMSDSKDVAQIHLSNSGRRWGTLVLSSGVFVTILDSSVTNVGIAHVAGNLGVSVQQAVWIVTSFAVGNAISIPLTSWLVSVLGLGRLFTAAVGLFTLTSLFCGLADSLELLVFFRFLQGVAAGPIAPISQALLAASYPPSKLNFALSLWGGVTLIAPTIGPVLGGWIVEDFSWPWLFLINIPFGLLIVIGSSTIYGDVQEKKDSITFDTIGFLLLLLGVTSLQIVMDQGLELDWFESTKIKILSSIFICALFLFIFHQFSIKKKILPFNLLAKRNFFLGIVVSSIAFGLFFGALVLIPVWLQSSVGYSALWAGLTLAPVGISAIVMSPLVGKLLSKIDARLLASLGLLFFSLTFHLRSDFYPEMSFWYFAIPSLFQGAAMALFFTPINAIVLSGLKTDEMSSAASLYVFVRTIFSGVITSLIVFAWTSSLVKNNSYLVESISTSSFTSDVFFEKLSQLNFSTTEINILIDGLVKVQAQTLALNNVFYGVQCLFLILIPIIWFSKKINSK